VSPSYDWLGPGQYMPSGDVGPFRRPPEDPSSPLSPCLYRPVAVTVQAAPVAKASVSVDDLLGTREAPRVY